MRQFGITRVSDGDRLVGGLLGGERQALAIGRARQVDEDVTVGAVRRPGEAVQDAKVPDHGRGAAAGGGSVWLPATRPVHGVSPCAGSGPR